MEKEIVFQKYFALAVIFLVGFNFWAIILATLGIFYPILLLVYPMAFLAYLGFLFFGKKITFSKINIPRDFLIAAGVSLAAVLFFSLHTTPSIFSGRDQGSFSEAAIRLSQNHKLRFQTPASEEFFKIYGPGKALNFPGFNYASDGKLTPHFPLGYISWLAIFYSFFGIFGLIFANSLALFFFLLSFFLLLKSYTPSFSAPLVSLFLFLTSFPCVWFSKLTLSENLALLLVWFSVLQFVIFLRNKNYFFLFSSLFSLSILAFSRVEAFALIAVVLGILFFKRKEFPELKNKFLKNRLTVMGFSTVIFFYCINIFVNFAYYKTIAKGALGSFSQNENLPGHSFSESLLYTLKIFNEYASLDFLLLFFLAIIYVFYKKKYFLFLPLAVILPTFVYLLHPGISFDHPWMLRRYVFSVLPACIFVSVWFLDCFFRQKIYFYVFSVLLLANNLAVSFPYLAFSENKNLLPQTEEISLNFEEKDLVLFDREASGDPFSMIGAPMNFLFQKQSAYFFNPEDLKKIDFDKFEKIYLVIPDKNLSMYQTDFLFDKLLFQKDYAILGEKLSVANIDRDTPWQTEVTLPEKEKFLVTGKIYLLDKNKF